MKNQPLQMKRRKNKANILSIRIFSYFVSAKWQRNLLRMAWTRRGNCWLYTNNRLHSILLLLQQVCGGYSNSNCHTKV